MPLYRKKTPVNAVQHDGPVFIANGGAVPAAPRGCTWLYRETGMQLVILTKEGPHDVTPGDWILGPGAHGEFWPVKADIFAATYEPVDLHAEPAPPISFDGVTQTPDPRFTIGAGCVIPRPPKPA